MVLHICVFTLIVRVACARLVAFFDLLTSEFVSVTSLFLFIEV